MSAKWTVERLDALPEGTVIEVLERGIIRWQYVKVPGKFSWEMVGEAMAETTRSVLFDDYDSIRVVSVPIDALLAEGVMGAVFDVLDKDGHNGYDCRPERPADVTAEAAIRAAVAHVTGEATP